MELRVSLAVSLNRENGGMSDWIKRYKQAEETNQRAIELDQERKRRADGILRTRGREMWNATIQQVQSDVKCLKEEFPTDVSKHLQLNPSVDGLVLERHTTQTRLVAC
jgi:hypothetical protein